MKDVKVIKEKEARSARMTPTEELREAERALAIARRKNRLCIYFGELNEQADDGYLGGICGKCLKKLTRGMKPVLG